jgi:hypothetical protein
METESVAAETNVGTVALEGATKDFDVGEPEDMDHSSSNEEVIAGNGDVCHVPWPLASKIWATARPVERAQHLITVRLAFCAEDPWHVQIKS